MTATAFIYGHEAHYDEPSSIWRYTDTGEEAKSQRSCQHCGRDEVLLNIGGKSVGVDACIAPIVKALNDGGIKTIACCCGHASHAGSIILADGRELLIAHINTGRR